MFMCQLCSRTGPLLLAWNMQVVLTCVKGPFLLSGAYVLLVIKVLGDPSMLMSICLQVCVQVLGCLCVMPAS